MFHGSFLPGILKCFLYLQCDWLVCTSLSTPKANMKKYNFLPNIKYENLGFCLAVIILIIVVTHLLLFLLP